MEFAKKMRLSSLARHEALAIGRRVVPIDASWSARSGETGGETPESH
jgi:hypothetical protein